MRLPHSRQQRRVHPTVPLHPRPRAADSRPTAPRGLRLQDLLPVRARLAAGPGSRQAGFGTTLRECSDWPGRPGLSTGSSSGPRAASSTPLFTDGGWTCRSTAWWPRPRMRCSYRSVQLFDGGQHVVVRVVLRWIKLLSASCGECTPCGRAAGGSYELLEQLVERARAAQAQTWTASTSAGAAVRRPHVLRPGRLDRGARSSRPSAVSRRRVPRALRLGRCRSTQPPRRYLPWSPPDACAAETMPAEAGPSPAPAAPAPAATTRPATTGSATVARPTG